MHYEVEKGPRGPMGAIGPSSGTPGKVGEIENVLHGLERDCKAHYIDSEDVYKRQPKGCFYCDSSRLARKNGNFEKVHLRLAYFKRKRYNIDTNWGMCLRTHT